MTAPLFIAINARVRFRAWWIPQVPVLEGTVTGVYGDEIKVRPDRSRPGEADHYVSREAIVEVMQ